LQLVVVVEHRASAVDHMQAYRVDLVVVVWLMVLDQTARLALEHTAKVTPVQLILL
jgi:hypothetical protein